MTYEWREGKTMRADIAVGLVTAQMESDDGDEQEIQMQVGVPCLVHKDEGLVWMDEEPTPLGPVGFRVAQMRLGMLMKQMRSAWPEACDAVDWGFVLEGPKRPKLVIPGQ